MARAIFWKLPSKKLEKQQAENLKRENRTGKVPINPNLIHQSLVGDSQLCQAVRLVISIRNFLYNSGIFFMSLMFFSLSAYKTADDYQVAIQPDD